VEGRLRGSVLGGRSMGGLVRVGDWTGEESGGWMTIEGRGISFTSGLETGLTSEKGSELAAQGWITRLTVDGRGVVLTSGRGACLTAQGCRGRSTVDAMRICSKPMRGSRIDLLSLRATSHRASVRDPCLVPRRIETSPVSFTGESGSRR
jgi:hypothetical protein